MAQYRKTQTIIKNKSILITGGTGSFGQKFVEFALKNLSPKKLVIFSRDELKQFDMAARFQEQKYPCLRYFIGDVRDRNRLMRALSGIEIVVHASAMKQIVAAEYNPTECIATNVIGAQNVIDAAIENGVSKVIAPSTDKAANLSIFMGQQNCVQTNYLSQPIICLAGRKPVFLLCAMEMLQAPRECHPLFQRPCCRRHLFSSYHT